MSRDETLRVAVDAQVETGGHGGIEQLLIGLLGALGRIDGAERYSVVGLKGQSDWLAPYLGPNQRLVFNPAYEPDPLEPLKRLLGPVRKPAGILLRAVRGGPAPAAGAPRIPKSDGFFESLNPQVLHLLYPMNYVESRIPTLVTIADLQHRHHPEFFSESHMAWREAVYPVAFSAARAIVAISDWVKQDVARQYGVGPDKIFVVPVAPGTEAYRPVGEEALARIGRKYRLPPAFALYPALTYGHKNHLRLLEAVALLRDKERIPVRLVCTGQRKLVWPAIEKRLRELRLQDQVQFLGFVGSDDLLGIYRLAQFMVFPSLFEGAGIPVIEALREGLPVACSGIPALREYAGDAAHYFDPASVEGIAQALRRMGQDAQLRAALRERGFARAKLFTWERSARVYRALYRHVAQRPLSEEDRQLLAAARP